MKREQLFRPPILNDRNGNLSKPWFVEIGYRDPKDGAMKRKRYQTGFTELRTKKARYAFADELIKNLIVKLQRGWIPPDDDKANHVVYTDELEYHQAAQIYGRKRMDNKNIRYYASEYILLIKNSKAKKTHESYRGKIRTFITWLEKNKLVENDLSTFDSAVIFKFFDFLITERQLAGKTIEKYKINLSNFFKFLVDRKIIREQPVRDIEIPETSEDFSAVPFLDEDLERLFPIIKDEDPQLFLAALMQYFCFIRPGNELLQMRIKQINFSAKTIFIPKDHAKRRTERTVDMPLQLYNVLMEFGIQHFGKEMFLFGRAGRPGNQPMGMNTLRSRFNRIRDKVGLSSSYKWYSFKHTGAGKLLESGATIAELMNQLGHTDISSTYRYIRRHFGERSEHIRNHFPDPPGLNRKWTEINWKEGLSMN